MLEIFIIAVLVIWSCYIVFKKVFPTTFNACSTGLADAAKQQGWTKLATYLRPKAALGCGGGCGCAVDDTKQPTQNNEIKAVKWK